MPKGDDKTESLFRQMLPLIDQAIVDVALSQKIPESEKNKCLKALIESREKQSEIAEALNGINSEAFCDTNACDDGYQLIEKYRMRAPKADAVKMEPATIMFEEEYCKMPYPAEDMMDPDRPTTLLAVLKVPREQLSPELIAWDTKFRWKPGNFELPDEKEFLLLLLLTSGHLWTTLRAARPSLKLKEDWYRSHVGEVVKIHIGGVKA